MLVSAVSEIKLQQVGQDEVLEMPGLILRVKHEFISLRNLPAHILHDLRHGVVCIQGDHEIQIGPLVAESDGAGAHLDQGDDPAALFGYGQDVIKSLLPVLYAENTHYCFLSQPI